MFPKPDRSNYKPNFHKTPDKDSLDIGWNEGVLSDGRPYRAEAWCQDQTNFLTYFFSTSGMEQFMRNQLIELLEREGLVRFVSQQRYVGAGILTDASGNEIFSLTVTLSIDRGDQFALSDEW